MSAKPVLGYVEVSYPEPHLERTRRLLAAHPEVRSLFGNVPWTSLFVFGIVALQTGMAFALRHSPWWAILLAAYTIGAVANHALWTLIHDCTHNLVFRSARANSWLQIIANLPIVFPSAISFRKYHLLHHRYQGDPHLDADLSSPLEARLVGNSSIKKAIWLLFFWVSQSLRIPGLKHIPFFDRWYVANLTVEVAYLTAVGIFAGPWALLFLFLSSMFAIGLHPVGARWIQEHYLVKPDQETYSYYGPMNLLAFNVGYHNEHHDLMRVPWNRLPKLKAMAPEFYDTLHFHTSWTKLLLKFLFDPSLSLYSRMIRPTKRPMPVETSGAAVERITQQAAA